MCSEEWDCKNHVRMNLIEFANVAVSGFVAFVRRWIFAFHLYGSDDFHTVCPRFGNNKIHAPVTVREVDIPFGVGQ